MEVVSVFLNHFVLTRVITESNFVYFEINKTTEIGSEYHFKSLILKSSHSVFFCHSLTGDTLFRSMSNQ